jgi:hypothetical protein
VILETVVLKQQYLQTQEYSNPTILVLEERNEEITNNVKQNVDELFITLTHDLFQFITFDIFHPKIWC